MEFVHPNNLVEGSEYLFVSWSPSAQGTGEMVPSKEVFVFSNLVTEGRGPAKDYIINNGKFAVLEKFLEGFTGRDGKHYRNGPHKKAS